VLVHLYYPPVLCVDRCAGCEALLQNLEVQVTTANSRKDKESKIAVQMEQEVQHIACLDLSADYELYKLVHRILLHCLNYWKLFS